MNFTRRAFAIAFAAACFAAGVRAVPPPSTTQPTTQPAPLRWAPPTLENPKTIELTPDGFSDTWLDPTKDFIIKLPPTLRTGGVMLQGGRNVVLIGGHITVGPNQLDDMHRRGIYIKNNVGTVHIEGVLIDNAANAEFDGIAIAAPQSIVQIQNCRIVNLTGTMKSNHSDVVQPWGGVKELRIDRLTGSSNYQGLFIPQDTAPIGRAILQNIDLFYSSKNPVHQVTYLLWMSKQENCETYPISLENVFISPREGQKVSEFSVYPSSQKPAPCTAVEENGVVNWPGIKTITGHVTVGAPPGGNFVPEGVAGERYVSPGYAEKEEKP